MRKLLCSLLILPLAGCGVELLTATAIHGELQAQNASAVMQQRAYAEDRINRMKIERAISAYWAETGVYPPSLQALVPNWLDSVPAQAGGVPYGYDPLTGRLTDSSQPEQAALPPITEADRDAMAALRSAIDGYRRDNGYYPVTLYSLVPYYITDVPVTSTNTPFNYNPRDGSLTHPMEAVRPLPQNHIGSTPVAGAGPLGEVTTSIAIQQQLDNMGPSAVGVGAGARYNVDQIQSDYSRRQMEAVDELLDN